MRGFVGGRDRGRTPGADPRAERNDRIKALEKNLGRGLSYDRFGRLQTDGDLEARIAALEAAAKKSSANGAAVVEKSFAATYVASGGSGSDPVAQSPVAGTFNIKTVSADYTVGLTDQVVWVDATSAAVTVTLPNALKSRGRWVYVEKVDASGYTANLVDAAGYSVGYGASVTLSNQGDGALFVAGFSGGAPRWGLFVS